VYDAVLFHADAPRHLGQTLPAPHGAAPVCVASGSRRVQERIISKRAAVATKAAVLALGVSKSVPIYFLCCLKINDILRKPEQVHSGHKRIHNGAGFRPMRAAEPVLVGVILRHTLPFIQGKQPFGHLQIPSVPQRLIKAENSPDSRQRGMGLHGNAHEINSGERLDHFLQQILQFRDIQIPIRPAKSIQAHIGAANIRGQIPAVYTISCQLAVRPPLEYTVFRSQRIPGIRAAPQRQIERPHQPPGRRARLAAAGEPGIVQQRPQQPVVPGELLLIETTGWQNLPQIPFFIQISIHGAQGFS